MSNRQLIPVPRLPRPLVAQAVGKLLTLQKPDGASGITVEVARWRAIAVGQPTTLHISGQNHDGSTMMVRVVDAEPVTKAEAEAGWCRSIGWDQLQELEHRSHLTFVFQAVLEESECACPALFPPLSLEIQEGYEDRTTFSTEDGTDNWNGWMRGAAASDGRDLIIRSSGGGLYMLQNRTYTGRSAGTVLSKTFSDLKANRIYEFGITVRRTDGQHAIPKLALMALKADMTTEEVASEEITSMDWTELKGTFTADQSTMELLIASKISTGYGNDYAFHDIWLKAI
ncbi:carbohydrate binding domain-containing protein [Pseudomonas sp. XS1P51]